MIVTELYNGQGLGNQLACYVTTRVLAADLGYDFGIMNPYKFKGAEFMTLNYGQPVIGGEGPEGGPPAKLPDGISYYFREAPFTLQNGDDSRLDDPALELIKDGTKIDGVFQSEDRIYHRRDEISEWLTVDPNFDIYDYCSNEVCVINFRGGEYVPHSKFFLNVQYWRNAVAHMLSINRNFRFIVVTDDPATAQRFFPKYPCVHSGIGLDYCIIKNAQYLILSNSSFPYFATLTSETIKHIIAPKYWGRHNVSDGYWHCGYNIYRNHTYMDRNGALFDYNTCKAEFEAYRKAKNWWTYYE